MNRNYLIVIGLGLATIAAFLLINYFAGEDPQSATPEATVSALEIEIEDLENSILELELIDEENRRDVSQMQTLLNEKNDKLRLMEEQIEQLERTGEADQVTIDELRARLNEAKAGLLDTYAAEINLLVANVSGLTRSFDSVLGANRRTDSAFYSLQQVHSEMDKAYRDCMEENNQAVPTEPVLPIMSAAITSIQTEGERNQTAQKNNFGTNILASNKFQTLKVCFSLKGNALVTSGKKTIYLVLTPENGSPLTNSAVYGRVSINYSDKTVGNASRQNDFDYVAGQEMNPCLDFEVDGKFPSGICKVELVYNGNRIATDRLFIP